MPENNKAKTGGRFRQGQSGNPSGRPKGVPNKATQEVTAVAATLVEDPIYRHKLLKDVRHREVAPAVERMIPS